MFTPSQLYDYLRYKFTVEEKNVVVRNFKDGSLNPNDLLEYINNTDTPYLDKTEKHLLDKSYGLIDMYDQEHIDLKMLKQNFVSFSLDLRDGKIPDKWQRRLQTNNITIDDIPFTHEYCELNEYDFITAISASMYKPIICHSEKNSKVVDTLTNQYNFLDVHYWCHGMLSRFWYNEYELLQNNRTENTKRFGLYARSIIGDSSYRLTILKELSKFHNNCFYKVPKELSNIKELKVWSVNDKDVDSNSSAYLDWYDHTKFDIHVVLETIFDKDKTHLTEKVIKPIVMYQPFIVVSGYKSLEYLKTYGFKTFNECWDESYDLEINHDKRMDKIRKLLNHLNNLELSEFKKIIDKTKKICEYNRKHFYSQEFKNLILTELHTNLEKALVEQEESYFDTPGGTLFKTIENLYATVGYIPDSYQKIGCTNLQHIKDEGLKNYLISSSSLTCKG